MPVLNAEGVVNFTDGKEGCCYGGAPLEVCPRCGKLGRPDRLAKTIRFVHSGRFTFSPHGEAHTFERGRTCVVKRNDV
jgi:hypothetical protein